MSSMRSSRAKDRHDAIARAINEVEMVNESGLAGGSQDLVYYRWQLPGSAVASEFLYHLQEQGYDVVKRNTDESVLP